MIVAPVAIEAPFSLPELPPIRRAAQVTYLDRTGEVIGVRGGTAAPPVELDRLPGYVPAAFVAIEDRRFYEHGGFDPVGIARAIVTDVTRGRTAQGASTITQQLARNLYLSQDQTVERKATELLYAVQLERRYSKRQILGLYLSRVYFGSGAYGIEAASRRFFGHGAAKLSIREAATLAGILKNPAGYSPVEHPEASAARTRLVLDAMVETGAITEGQRTRALSKPLKVRKASSIAAAQYFVDWADLAVRRTLGPARTDLVVDTTLDLALEDKAAEAASATAERHAAQGVQQAAVVGLDGIGRVRVLVGGVDYARSQFDRAVDARRQAGSSWKPFVYLTAMEAGRAPETPVVDEPITIGTWSPRNYEPGYLGPITLQTALAHSINTVAARLADELGRANVAATARRLGISTPINTDPAMALGTSQVSPLEMAQAYAAFSNGGLRVQAFGVERVRTSTGQVVWRKALQPPPRVMAEPALSEMTRMLRAVIASGTGVKAAIPGADVAGKTGTTSDYRDAWFCGFTGGYATVVWLGRDDATSMRGVTGGSAPAELWRTTMRQAIAALPVRAIPQGPAPVAPFPTLQTAGYTPGTGPEAPPEPTATADPVGALFQSPPPPPPPPEPPAQPF